MANFTRVGYGQVEPNQLSAQKTGQIYASLPLDPKVEVLQNGEFMFYDYATGRVTAEGKGEPMLVFNEIKLYEPFWRTSYKDFAMIRVGDNYVTSKPATAGYGDGALTKGASITPDHTEYPYRMDGIAPRLFKTNIGDIYTTNCLQVGNTDGKKEVTMSDLTVGDILQPNATGYLTKATSPTAGVMQWQVVKVYTLADGQAAVKVMRIA